MGGRWGGRTATTGSGLDASDEVGEHFLEAHQPVAQP